MVLHPVHLHSPPPPELMTLTLFSCSLLLPRILRRQLLQTTCHLPCLSTTRSECKTTALRRQAHLALLDRSLGPLRISLVRSHCQPHLLKTRAKLRPEGQTFHSPISSRTAVSQTPSPSHRDHQANHSNPNNHIFRRRCSKLRMHRNHLRIRLLLLNNPRLSRLCSLVVA